MGIIALWATWTIYRDRESPTRKLPIDTVGLALLVLWIAALQIMLDKGKELDWFASGQIVLLAVVAVVGFVFFLIWELNEEHPVVDLRLFAGRNFTMGAVVLSVAYGVFFGSVVLLPLWLQTQMGYTATEAGFVLAPVGILALIVSPIVGRSIGKVDPRLIATIAFVLFAIVSYMRARFQPRSTCMTLMIPTIIQGAAVACFFIPLVYDHPVGPAAGEDPERLGPVELRAHHRGRFRHVDLDHAVGRPREHASRAPHRVGQPGQQRGGPDASQLEGAGMSATQALADDRSHGHAAGLLARRQRRVLRVRAHLHRPVAADLDGEASEGRRRGRRGRRALAGGYASSA